MAAAGSTLVWASAIAGVTTNAADRKATILICLITVSFQIRRMVAQFTERYSSANTQTDPPSGTSGYSPGKTRLRFACIALESPPQPECTAMYCLPSIENDVGGARIPELVGNSQSSLPVDASNAWMLRSLVPPLNTSPPAVASIEPQFGLFA